MLLWGRKRWSTVDAAIAEATGRSVLDARGIDYAAVRADNPSADQGIVLAAQTQVLAALGRFTQLERALLSAYAHGWSYRDLAREARLSLSTARRRHVAARERMRTRLLELDLLAE